MGDTGLVAREAIISCPCIYCTFDVGGQCPGHVVSSYGWGNHFLMTLSRKAATYSGVFVLLPLLTGEGRAHHGEILRQATQLAEAGQLRPIVDPRQFTLNTALAAHEAVEQGTAVSKIVIDID